MARDTSYRLDNVGKFYSAQAGRSAQTVFRIAADMADTVDPEPLQRAFDSALEAFPGFNVTLRSGLFWHYFAQATEKPRVQPEVLPVCSRMHADARSHLIRVSYFAHRINLEVSHMVSDGRGAMEFFKALVGLYVQKRYGAAVDIAPYGREEAHKTEDSFSANYERSASAATEKPRAWRIRGWRDAALPAFMELHLPASAVRGAAKEAGVGVTPLLLAAILCAIRDGMGEAARARGRAICINVPVDLRRFFGSATLRNFFGLACVSYTPGAVDEPLADVAAHVAAQLRAVTQPEALKRRMNRMVKLQRNPLLRVAPVFLKDAVLGVAAKVAERDFTTTASNIGRVELPGGVEGYVRGVVVLTSTTNINFVMATYGDDLSIGISSVLVSADIVRRFARTFSDMGIEGTMNVSRTRAEVDVALRQEALERALARRGEGGDGGDAAGGGGDGDGTGDAGGPRGEGGDAP